MKKIFKKITAVITAAFLLSASVGFDVPGSITAGAEELKWDCGINAGDMTATLDNGVLTISGTGAMADYEPGRDMPWYDNNFRILKKIAVHSSAWAAICMV